MDDSSRGQDVPPKKIQLYGKLLRGLSASLGKLLRGRYVNCEVDKAAAGHSSSALGRIPVLVNPAGLVRQQLLSTSPIATTPLRKMILTWPIYDGNARRCVCCASSKVTGEAGDGNAAAVLVAADVRLPWKLVLIFQTDEAYDPCGAAYLIREIIVDRDLGKQHTLFMCAQLLISFSPAPVGCTQTNSDTGDLMGRELASTKKKGGGGAVFGIFFLRFPNLPPLELLLDLTALRSRPAGARRATAIPDGSMSAYHHHCSREDSRQARKIIAEVCATS